MPVERARPLLGTLVAIRVAGLAPADEHAAIDAAFAEVAVVHRRMSFHEPTSDVSQLNRSAAQRAVLVDPRTLAVLRLAQQLAERSGGCFDVTVGGPLVARRRLPAPAGAPRPHTAASWRDVEIERDGRVRFHRPLWIDVGGIAKGYAVDRAIARLRAHGVAQACVNAGGDLRVLGPTPERVALRTGLRRSSAPPVIEIENGSLASSTGRGQARRHRGRLHGPHLDGAGRRAVGLRRFACVTAERCVIADALTKVVLSRGVRSAPLLNAYGATAFLHDARGRWRRIGAGA